jgi:hypothetical protein
MRSSPQFATPSMTREQIAQHIADGFPSPVSYVAYRFEDVPGMPGYIQLVNATPVHLRRAIDSKDLR